MLNWLFLLESRTVVFIYHKKLKKRYVNLTHCLGIIYKSQYLQVVAYPCSYPSTCRLAGNILALCPPPPLPPLLDFLHFHWHWMILNHQLKCTTKPVWPPPPYKKITKKNRHFDVHFKISLNYLKQSCCAQVVKHLLVLPKLQSHK